MIAIIRLERGIPSKRTSSACIDYVPALCTHRPSLLPIAWSSECCGGVGVGVLCSCACAEATQTWVCRGSKSRNKVSVGEPAEGSLAYQGRSVCNAERSEAAQADRFFYYLCAIMRCGCGVSESVCVCVWVCNLCSLTLSALTNPSILHPPPLIHPSLTHLSTHTHTHTPKLVRHASSFLS